MEVLDTLMYSIVAVLGIYSLIFLVCSGISIYIFYKILKKVDL